MESENKSFTYRLANDQISRIQKNYDQPGWTLWALLIAIANVIWIGINELEINLLSINIEESILITFVIIFFYFGINALLRTLAYRKPDMSQNRFEYPNFLLRGSRVTILFELFILVTLLIVAKNYLVLDQFSRILLKTFIYIYQLRY